MLLGDLIKPTEVEGPVPLPERALHRVRGYCFDALGRRVRKTAMTGTTTRYLWDGDDLVMELGPGNAVLREYSYYPGIDQPHAVRIPAVTRSSPRQTDES